MEVAAGAAAEKKQIATDFLETWIACLLMVQAAYWQSTVVVG